MDSLDVIRVCLKRWYIVLPVLLLAAGAGLGLARTTKVTYTAAASFAFVWEHADEVGAREPDPRVKNPLAADGTGLLGESVVASLTSVATQERLGGTNRGYAPGKADDDSHFSVLQDDGQRSYTVRTWADSPEQALDVVKGVLAAVPAEAEKLQVRAGAPKISRYSTFETSLPEMVRLPPESPIKLLVAVMGVGLLAAAALALVVDRLLNRRSTRVTENQDSQAPQDSTLAPRIERANTYLPPEKPVAGGQNMPPTPRTDWGFQARPAGTAGEFPPTSESATADLPPVSMPAAVATPNPAPPTGSTNGHPSPSVRLGSNPVEHSVEPSPDVGESMSLPPSPEQPLHGTRARRTRGAKRNRAAQARWTRDQPQDPEPAAEPAALRAASDPSQDQDQDQDKDQDKDHATPMRRS